MLMLLIYNVCLQKMFIGHVNVYLRFNSMQNIQYLRIIRARSNATTPRKALITLIKVTLIYFYHCIVFIIILV